jgi:RNA 2',3'-cyclic 3'-phosphodiesterase
VAARLFVALDLPGAVVEALVAWRAPLLREREELRAVAPEALHVTLCFLGAQPEGAIPPLADAAAACAARAGAVAGLALGEALWLPPRRPRALALAVGDRHGELGALQARLADRLAEEGWHEPEGRPYLPHATLARVRGREPLRLAGPLPAVPAVSFDGAAVTLYRSRLRSSGARYEPLSVSRLA